jgi:hypothetical protein
MSESPNSPDWDDEDPATFDGDEPIFIDDEDFPGEIPSLTELKREIFQDRVIHSFVREAWGFNGREAINEIILEVERKMGWKLEIVATQGAVDNSLMDLKNTFDEDAWIHYLMSDEYRVMTYRVLYESELAVDDFMVRFYGNLPLGARIRRYIKNKLWNLFANL